MNPNDMRERDRAIQDAMQAPTTHTFSDHDNTPQGQKAIAIGIHNRQTNAAYDYRQSPGANFNWPDFDPSHIGQLEPWLCYGIKPGSGWMDLNAIASGRERRGAAAFQTLGYNLQPPFDRVDTPAFTEIDRLLGLDEGSLAYEAPRLGMKADTYYTFRDYLIGMRRDYDNTRAKSMGRAQKGLDVANQYAQAQMQQNVNAAKAGGLLDPVNGISLEDWAAANAKIMSGTPMDTILGVLGVDKASWDAASAQWTARMSSDTTFAVSKVYGDAFVNSNIGKFAQAGLAAPPASAAVEKVKSDFELYVKVMTHQSVAAQKGVDATAVLAKYGLTVLDWSTVSSYWGPKMSSDMSLAMKVGELMTRYTQELAAQV
jgi:hypothetical protein